MAARDDDVIEQFRANGGRVGGPFADYDLLLLTTIGTKSGVAHTKPVMYIRDGERLVIVAANAGASTDPAWYRNLLAVPVATVELGTSSVEVVAEVVDPGAERDRLFGALIELLPVLGDYARAAHRVIPVVTLTPRPS